MADTPQKEAALSDSTHTPAPPPAPNQPPTLPSMKGVMKPHRYMVAVDNSDIAKQAFEKALAKAGSEDQLIVVNCWPLVNAPCMSDELEGVDCDRYNRHSRKHSEALLDELGKRCKDEGKFCRMVSMPTPVHGASGIGQHLCSEAKVEKIDCIFIGSQGLTGLRRAALGSVSNYVANHSPCDVTVVRPRDREPPVQE